MFVFAVVLLKKHGRLRNTANNARVSLLQPPIPVTHAAQTLNSLLPNSTTPHLKILLKRAILVAHKNTPVMSQEAKADYPIQNRSPVQGGNSLELELTCPQNGTAALQAAAQLNNTRLGLTPNSVKPMRHLPRIILFDSFGRKKKAKKTSIFPKQNQASESTEQHRR